MNESSPTVKGISLTGPSIAHQMHFVLGELCVCVYIHACLHTYMCVSVHTHVSVYMSVCVSVCVHGHVDACVHAEFSVLFFRYCTLCLLGQGLSLAWSIPRRRD